MKRIQALLIAMLLSVAAWAADTRQYTVADVPNVRLEDARQYVSDPAAILSPAARDTINAVLARLERSTGIESAVVMLPSIGDADIFGFSHELFRTWGIGKKKSDNGFLIVFVMDQRKVRFTTGYGIEGTMTDALSKRIQTTVMVPRFREADWDGGMVGGVRAAAKALDGSMEPEAGGDDGDDGALAVLAIVLIVVVAIAGIVVLGTRQRCPKCRRRGALQEVHSEILRVSGQRRRVRRTTYICKYCGHTVVKDEFIDDDPGSALATGALLGSILGSGGRGGGGSFGGSFGGGSTGGGGATSDW